MAQHRRIFFTDKQKSEIWDRWKSRESMSSIGSWLAVAEEDAISRVGTPRNGPSQLSLV